MSEITTKTIETIWHCRREIETAEKLLADLAKEEERSRYDMSEPSLQDSARKKLMH